MNELKEANYDVIALGKIADIYANSGVTESIRTVDNADGMDQLIASMDKDFMGISFLNLVDFDAKYGHRRDPIGYGKALEAFDKRIPDVLDKLRYDNLQLFNANHFNDPTHHGTYHTREYVPLLIYHNHIQTDKRLPIRETFAD